MKRIGVVGIPGGWSSECLADALEKHTGYRQLIDPSRLVIDLERGTALEGDRDLTSLDAVVIKKAGRRYTPEHLNRLELLRYLCAAGVCCISDPLRITRVLNRLTCTVTLRAAGIPMPPTVVTESVEEATAAVEAYGQAVLKPLLSTKARGMVVVEAGPTARDEIERFQADGHPTIYVQRKIDLPDRDLGVVFLDGEHVGTYARVRGSNGSWNTTTRAGGVYEAHEASPAVIELARQAQEPFGLDFTSVDVAETADGPLVFEVSAFGGLRGLLEGPGIDAADLIARYALTRAGNG